MKYFCDIYRKYTSHLLLRKNKIIIIAQPTLVPVLARAGIALKSQNPSPTFPPHKLNIFTKSYISKKKIAIFTRNFQEMILLMYKVHS